MSKRVTIGWDGWPTIELEGGYVLPRKAELSMHGKHYPNWPEERWPVDPETGERLPIAEKEKSPGKNPGRKLLNRKPIYKLFSGANIRDFIWK
jgi:hypothetical protein